MALGELLEKGGDSDLLREMIAFLSQRLMDMEAETLCGAGMGERSPERLNSRNGYRDRGWDTRVGSIDLKIPKLRKGSYFPSFLEPRRTAEKAMAAVIQEAYVQGVSTRSVDDLVKAMGMTGISKSQSLPRRRPGSAGSARSWTSGSRPSSIARSRATGLICGSTPPTSRQGKPGALSRSRR